MSLHEVILFVHGTLRWIVLALGVGALVRTIRNARAARAWTERDTKVLRSFVMAFDIQVCLGLFMYFATSALGVRMYAHAGEGMKTATLRFFMVEHAFGMIAAAAILHVGVAKLKRKGESSARQRSTAIVLTVALLIIGLTIPWPFFPYGRPLFRLG